MIEGWLLIVTRKAVTNTSFASTAEFTERIDRLASPSNDDPQRFVWTNAVDGIMTKIQRELAVPTEAATWWSGRCRDHCDALLCKKAISSVGFRNRR
jgi:hypothetical protein